MTMEDLKNQKSGLANMDTYIEEARKLGRKDKKETEKKLAELKKRSLIKTAWDATKKSFERNWKKSTTLGLAAVMSAGVSAQKLDTGKDVITVDGKKYEKCDFIPNKAEMTTKNYRKLGNDWYKIKDGVEKKQEKQEKEVDESIDPSLNQNYKKIDYTPSQAQIKMGTFVNRNGSWYVNLGGVKFAERSKEIKRDGGVYFIKDGLVYFKKDGANTAEPVRGETKHLRKLIEEGDSGDAYIFNNDNEGVSEPVSLNIKKENKENSKPINVTSYDDIKNYASTSKKLFLVGKEDGSEELVWARKNNRGKIVMEPGPNIEDLRYK